MSKMGDFIILAIIWDLPAFVTALNFRQKKVANIRIFGTAYINLSFIDVGFNMCLETMLLYDLDIKL